MTYYTTESEKTQQKPPNALKTAFLGETIQAPIFPPSINRKYLLYYRQNLLIKRLLIDFVLF